MPGTVLKVCGGWVVGGWLRPILVFSLSLDQAEQYFNDSRETPAGDEGRHYFLTFLYFMDSLVVKEEH